MNIIELLEYEGYIYKRQASTNGGEYAGPCPWCGGIDRFRVWPNYKNGRYWCRQCNMSGDNIQYLRDSKGMSYKEACQYLNITPKFIRNIELNINYKNYVWTPKKIQLPKDLWSDKAEDFLNKISQELNDNSKKILNHRGISDNIIKKYRLLWNKKDVFIKRQDWGLADVINNKTGKPKKIWIPQGLIIPYIFDERVIRLRVRRPKSEDGKPYIIVPGSDMRPMVLNNSNNKVVIVVESELDAMLLYDKAGDIASIIALGNAQSRPDKICHDILLNTETILLALDSDAAGSKETWRWWDLHYKIKRWPSALGKDPGEDYQKGIDIRSWVMAGLL